MLSLKVHLMLRCLTSQGGCTANGHNVAIVGGEISILHAGIWR